MTTTSPSMTTTSPTTTMNPTTSPSPRSMSATMNPTMSPTVNPNSMSPANTPENHDVAAPAPVGSQPAASPAPDQQSGGPTLPSVAEPVGSVEVAASTGEAVDEQHSPNMQLDPENPPGGGVFSDDGNGATPPKGTRKRRRGGAPKGNRNRVTHGLRRTFTTGRLPRGSSYIGGTLQALRREIETALLARDGAIGIGAAAATQTACRHERTAQLAQKWLAENPEMPLELKLKFANQVAVSSEARDRALKALGLDPRPADRRSVAASLYTIPHQPTRETLIESTREPVEPLQEPQARDMGDGAPASH